MFGSPFFSKVYFSEALFGVPGSGSGTDGSGDFVPLYRVTTVVIGTRVYIAAELTADIGDGYLSITPVAYPSGVISGEIVLADWHRSAGCVLQVDRYGPVYLSFSNDRGLGNPGIVRVQVRPGSRYRLAACDPITVPPRRAAEAFKAARTRPWSA